MSIAEEEVWAPRPRGWILGGGGGGAGPMSDSRGSESLLFAGEMLDADGIGALAGGVL